MLGDVCVYIFIYTYIDRLGLVLGQTRELGFEN